MKTIITILAVCILIPLSARAQTLTYSKTVVVDECPADTTETTVAAATATTGNDDMYEESDFNFDFPFKPSSSKPKRSILTMSFCESIGLGFVAETTMADNGPRFDMNNSYEIFVPSLFNFIYTPFAGGPSFSVGFLGSGYKNLLTHQGFYFGRTGEPGKDAVTVEQMPEGSYKWSARIQQVSLYTPIAVRQPFGNRAFVELSGMLVLTRNGRLVNKYKIDGKKHEDSWNTNATRPLGFDMMLRVKYDNMGLYVKYSPTPTFREGAGPKLTTISTGIMLYL